MHNLRNIIGQTLKSIFSIFSTIVIFFNFFAGLVGGIWLLFLGLWRVVLLGLLASLTMPWSWAFVSLPSTGIVLLCFFFAKKKMKIGVAASSFLAGLYDSFIQTGWIAIIFYSCLVLVLEREYPVIPIFLYGYAIATTPFLCMASKESPENFGTTIATIVIVIGSMLTVILFLLGIPLIYPLLILCVLMLIKTIFLSVVTILLYNKEGEDN